MSVAEPDDPVLLAMARRRRPRIILRTARRGQNGKPVRKWTEGCRKCRRYGSARARLSLDRVYKSVMPEASVATSTEIQTGNCHLEMAAVPVT
ncbi:hypothetical protein J6590_060274 [Homalodisca vitripennis]|nr:hypothetical protein J6590_060274 [Homalodisca vitripennis]